MKTLQLVASAFIVVAGAYFRFEGVERSLWLDEAWVANSLLEPSLSEMFFYDKWLQTTPPGFLVLARLSIQLWGLQNMVFRLVPYICSVWALIATWLALKNFIPSRRFFILPVALAAFAFAPLNVEYARNLKQYSSDVAVAATLLYLAQSRRSWLTWALPVAPFFSYPAVFLIPGLIFLAPRKALTIAASLASFLFLHLVFIQPNQSAALRAHWAFEYHSVNQIKRLLSKSAILFYLSLPCLLLVRRRLRMLFSLVLAPILLAAAAEMLDLYPLTGRTAMFLLPSLTLALGGSIWAGLIRFRYGANWVLVPACLLVAIASIRVLDPPAPVERLDEAMIEIYSRYQTDDSIYVHSTVAEGFRLYSKALNFRPARVLWGSTGSPCCPRNLPPQQVNDPIRLRSDMKRLFPHRPLGRVWVFWTNRAEHWRVTGYDERLMIEGFLEKEGCTKKPTLPLESVGVLLFACGV